MACDAYKAKKTNASELVISEIKKENENQRKITLALFDLEGDENQILRDMKFTKKDLKSTYVAKITRGQYVELIRNIITDKEYVRVSYRTLAKKIITFFDWRGNAI